MRRTPRLTTLLLALGLVVAAFFFLRRHATPPAPSRKPAATVVIDTPPAPRVAGPSAVTRTRPIALTPATAVADDAAPNGAVEGRVVDWGSGKGVAGADVTFSVDGSSSPVVADDEGRFQFSPPRPGRCAIALVTAKGYLPFAPEWGTSPLEVFARPRQRVRDVVVVLVPAIDYVAVVVSADQKPVAGAVVTLLGAAHGERALSPIEERFVTDAAGEAHFHAPDRAVLEARHPAHGVGRARLDGPAQTSHRLVIRLGGAGDGGAARAETITGRVVDASGAPVPFARVRAEPRDEPVTVDSLRAEAEAKCDAGGLFTLGGLDPGLYEVSAHEKGFAPAIAPRVPAGASSVVLSLRRGGSITGRVLASDGGAPLPAFTVIVARPDGPLKEVPVDARTAIDPDGRFTVPDLEPGEYRVRATAHGHAPSRAASVVVLEPPAEAAPITLALGAGGKLTGKVIDAGGAPLALARVSIENILGDGASAAPVTASAVTDERGDFELAGVPPGPRSILFAAYRHHMRLLSGMTFADGATVGPITVDLTPTKDGEEPRIELVGIGAVLVAEGEGLRIDKIIAGGGAEAAGLVRGDVILAVDGAPVKDLGFDGSIQRIRGPEGSVVRLRLRREGGAEVEIAAPRKRIRA